MRRKEEVVAEETYRELPAAERHKGSLP